MEILIVQFSLQIEAKFEIGCSTWPEDDDEVE
jgi:hypothetical protein